MAYDKNLVAERLKEVLTDSQEVTAKKLGMTQGNVSKLLSGTQQPTIDTVYRISEEYGVSADWILGLSNIKQIPNNGMSYGDILKEFIKLGENGIVWPYPNNMISVDGTNPELPQVTSFGIADEILQSILYEWKKMIAMEPDIYELWVEKRLREYSDIPYIQWNERTRELFYEVKDPRGVTPDFLKEFLAYCERENNPKGKWEKAMYGATSYKALGFFMMKLNLYDVIKENLGTDEFDSELINTTKYVLDTFYNKDMGIMFENVCPDGRFDLESMNGRMTNPGHALEAMWFIMNTSNKLGAKENVDKALQITLNTLEYGWDKEYDGIYYFKDALGKPHLELQWNMKLFWVHNEALIATAMAYKLTGKKEYLDWFEKLHNYSWNHFRDEEFGEWFCYLDRYGKLTHTLKGGKWKTFFHVPRCLYMVSELF